VLRPAVLEAALDRAIDLLRADDRDRERARRRDELTKRLATLEQALANLAETAASDGAVPAVMALLARKDAERRDVIRELTR